MKTKLKVVDKTKDIPRDAPRLMLLPFGWSKRYVYAGPYARRLPEAVGVKLAPEVKGDCDLLFPIRDFEIPPDKAKTDETVLRVLDLLLHAKVVYVGCRGGLGRTGLFLALLVKTLGESDPIGYVRKHYRIAAVETPEQEAYIKNYRPPLSFWGRWLLKTKALWTGDYMS